MDLAQTYDDIADDWNNEHKESTWWMSGIDAFLAMLPKGSSVLDVGCGPGFKAKYIADRGLEVTGIDISSRQIELARETAPEVQFAVHDVRAITDLGTFDGIMLFASLLHIAKNEVDAVLAAVRDSLTNNGAAYIVVKQTKEGAPDEEEKEETSFGKTFTRFFSYFTADELRDRMTRAGFDVDNVTIEPEGRATWIHVYAHKR